MATDSGLTRIVSCVEISAARKRAARTAGQDAPALLQEVLARSFALADMGERAALEVATSMVHADASRAPYTPQNTEQLLRACEQSPELTPQFIASTHQLLRNEPRSLQPVSIDGHTYARTVATQLPLVVGYEEHVGELEWLCEQLCFYNPKRGVNPELSALRPGVILHGPPGSGKSNLCRYASAYLHGLAHVAGLPVVVEQFSPHDYSKWVGESAQNLRNKIRRVQHPHGVGLLLLDDIDMLLQSREDTSATHGSLQVTAELMAALSGVGEEYRGNWCVLATTNRLDDIDPALRRSKRLGTHIEVPGFTQKKQYKALVDSVADWLSADVKDAVVSFSHTHAYTPAQVTSIVSRIDKARRGRPGKSLFSLAPNERHSVYQQSWSQVTIQTVQKCLR